MRLLTIILFCGLATACSSHPSLYVRMQYWGREALASTIVDTPDPEKRLPPSQRLIIEWSIPSASWQEGNCALHITCRLKNGDFLKETYPIDSCSGTYLFPVAGKNYTEKGGIFSYLVELKSGDTTLASSHHKLWVTPIQLTDAVTDTE